MTNQEFLIEFEKSVLRSKKTLMKKEAEYSQGKDRLDQFHRAASAEGTNPAEALRGMMTKHFTSICDMCKDPTSHSLRQWNEKLGDLRNYTFLLDALVRDLGAK